MLPVAIAFAGQLACASAADLEASLNRSDVQPYMPQIEAVSPSAIAITPEGGFRIAAPTAPLGQIVELFSPMAWFETECQMRMTWRPAWTSGSLSGASRFTVSGAPGPLAPSNSYGDLTYRIEQTPEGSRLTIEKAGDRVGGYRLDMRATAVSLLPELHTAAVRLSLIGVQSDGSVTYAEFRVFPGNAP